MMLEHMVCSECGEVFDDELFAEDPSETFVCPLCGTVALDAVPRSRIASCTFTAACLRRRQQESRRQRAFRRDAVAVTAGTGKPPPVAFDAPV
jgi:hypothetical protein